MGILFYHRRKKRTTLLAFNERETEKIRSLFFRSTFAFFPFIER